MRDNAAIVYLRSLIFWIASTIKYFFEVEAEGMGGLEVRGVVSKLGNPQMAGFWLFTNDVVFLSVPPFAIQPQSSFVSWEPGNN